MKKRILVVDDEKEVCDVIAAILDKTGRFETKKENSSIKVIEAAEEFKPDLITMDLMMPEVDGASLASQIRENQQLKNIPIIYITGLITKAEESTHACDELEDYIAKPLDAKELIDKINALIS